MHWHSQGDLTDALRTLSIQLPPWGFTPEMLSLFLLFSDRSLEKASVHDLELLPAPRALVWADIIEEDPMTKDIWEGVDLARSSVEWLDSIEYRPRS